MFPSLMLKIKHLALLTSRSLSFISSEFRMNFYPWV